MGREPFAGSVSGLTIVHRLKSRARADQVLERSLPIATAYQITLHSPVPDGLGSAERYRDDCVEVETVLCISGFL